MRNAKEFKEMATYRKEDMIENCVIETGVGVEQRRTGLRGWQALINPVNPFTQQRGTNKYFLLSLTTCLHRQILPGFFCIYLLKCSQSVM